MKLLQILQKCLEDWKNISHLDFCLVNLDNTIYISTCDSKQVAEEIKKQYNIDVDKRKVVLDCDIKEFGTYHAEVKLFTGVSAKIDVQVSEA